MEKGMSLSALKCTNKWWHFPTTCSLSLMPPHAGALTDSALKAGKGLTSLNFQPESFFFKPSQFRSFVPELTLVFTSSSLLWFLHLFHGIFFLEQTWHFTMFQHLFSFSVTCCLLTHQTVYPSLHLFLCLIPLSGIVRRSKWLCPAEDYDMKLCSLDLGVWGLALVTWMLSYRALLEMFLHFGSHICLIFFLRDIFWSHWFKPFMVEPYFLVGQSLHRYSTLVNDTGVL